MTSDLFNDLRMMRHDVVHHRAVATRERTDRWTELRWFNVGDPIILNAGHYTDFLQKYPRGTITIDSSKC